MAAVDAGGTGVLMPYPASPEHHERIKRRMNTIDHLSPQLRALVHEHGWAIVKAFLDHGVTKPRIIDHLIRTVRRGGWNRTDTDQRKEDKE